MAARLFLSVVSALEWDWGYRHQKKGTFCNHFENKWWPWWQLLPISQAGRALGQEQAPRPGLALGALQAVHRAMLGVTATHSGSLGEAMPPVRF